MAEIKQLTPEELKSIKDLQTKLNQTIFELGTAEAQLYSLKESILEIEKTKAEITHDLVTVGEAEKKLMGELESKYGQCNVDSVTGLITPLQ